MRKIVGIDIGEDSVKMLYCVSGELKKAAVVETPDNMVGQGRILSMDAMADFLRETAKAHGIPLTNAALVLPSAKMFTRVMTVPAMTEQQLKYNLPYEFRDFLTEEKSKYFFDYSVRRIVRDENGDPKEMELLACAMLKQEVEDYRAMLRRAGFKLKELAPLECAYEALVDVDELSGEDLCIVYVGQQSSHLYIYHDGAFDSHRSIETCLNELDELIGEHCSVDVHVARSYRRTNYNNVLASDYARALYNRLGLEVVKAVNFYNYNNRGRELQNVYVCGGDGDMTTALSVISQNEKLHLHRAETLIPDELLPEEDARLYLGAAGVICEGIRGGVK